MKSKLVILLIVVVFFLAFILINFLLGDFEKVSNTPEEGNIQAGSSTGNIQLIVEGNPSNGEEVIKE